MSFKTKLLRSFLFIVLVPALVGMIAIGIITQKNIKNEVSDNAEQMAGIVEVRIREKLIGIQNLVNYALMDQDLMDLFSENNLPSPYETARQLRESLDQFESMASVALDGSRKIVFYTDGPLSDLRLSILPIEDFSEKSTPLGKYSFDQTTKTIIFPVRMKTGDNKTIMAIQIQANSFISEDLFDENEFLYALTFQDYTIMGNASDRSKFAYEKKVGKELFSLHLQPRTTNFVRQIILIGLLILFLAIVIFLNMWKQYQGILKIIGDLQLKVNRVIENEEDVDFTSHYDDELGRLSNDIASMVGHLREANKELYQTRLEKEQLNYQMLVKQFDSHFLYNTLSFLNWRSYENQDKEMSQLIKKLSQYYRASLNKGKTEITLENELKNVQTYLEIRKLLNPELFNYEIKMQPEIGSYPVINLLFQPLVENAIEHAFSTESCENKISITAFMESDQLIIEVLDNGKGIPEEILQQLNNEETGYGVINTKKRFMYYFGSNAEFLLKSKQNYGTVIILRIPKRTDLSFL